MLRIKSQQAKIDEKRRMGGEDELEAQDEGKDED